jgi:hypothetical protein
VDSPASIVFMRARVSKVHHKPIAKMLGDPSIETLDDWVIHALYRLDHLMDLFGIKWSGVYRRSHASTPQHC